MGCLWAGSYADHESGILGGMAEVGCYMLLVSYVYMKVCRNLCPDAINRAAIFVARKSAPSITPARRKTRLSWLGLEGGEASSSIALLILCAAP